MHIRRHNLQKLGKQHLFDSLMSTWNNQLYTIVGFFPLDIHGCSLHVFLEEGPFWWVPRLVAPRQLPEYAQKTEHQKKTKSTKPTQTWNHNTPLYPWIGSNLDCPKWELCNFIKKIRRRSGGQSSQSPILSKEKQHKTPVVQCFIPQQQQQQRWTPPVVLQLESARVLLPRPSPMMNSGWWGYWWATDGYQKRVQSHGITWYDPGWSGCQ